MRSAAPRFMVYAPNVHTGGGAVLLRAALEAWPKGVPLVAWLDARARLKFRLPDGADVRWVHPTPLSRLRAEVGLARTSRGIDRVLCFHGLPPLLPNRSELLILQQNKNYLGLVPLGWFSWRTRQRLRFEQAVAYVFRRRGSSYWVQSPSMAHEVKRWYGEEPVEIHVLPYSPDFPISLVEEPQRWDFIYVADGEAHKNHRRLVEAWMMLAREGLRPSLLLTLSDRDAELMRWIDQKVAEHSLEITNLGHLAHENLLRYYRQCQALIFPSISESFGLPLVEARQFGLKIVASESDFVRDVCKPAETFDPYSSLSIFRSVKRFLGHEEVLLRPVNAPDFLKALMGDQFAVVDEKGGKS